MKTFIRTIIVFVVLNLAVASFAMVRVEEAIKDTEAQVDRTLVEIERLVGEIEKAENEANKKEMKAALMQKRAELAAALATQKELQAAQRQVLEAYKQAEAAPRQQKNLLGDYLKAQISGVGRSRLLTDRHDGSGQVFVIPAAEIKAKDLVTIMEDMSVMSRILDKKLDLSPGGIFPGGYGGGGMGGYGGGGMGRFGGISFFGSPGARSTESIFLQGYGALFLIKVDFPLSPPAEEKREEEPEEDMDALWEETRREIYEPADARRRTDEEEEEYDEEKVKELRETLIKALKHGANIRNLKPDESVILTVTGGGSNDRGVSKLRILGDIDGPEEILYQVPTDPFLGEMGFSPTVMTIRARKSDVDSFAKGKLDFDKFRQKVQIFTY